MDSHHHHHDSYIDYSCSTSVERLARDVETILQSWHVANGSDRHVSRSHAASGRREDAASNGAGSSGSSKNVRSTLSARRSSSSLGDSSTRSLGADEFDHRLIRSQKIAWDLALSGASSFSQESTIRVQLQLSLWDGPSKSTDHQQPRKDDLADDDESESGSNLPHSLDRPVALDEFPNDFLENISSLFGIGQHITLSIHDQENNKEETAEQASGDDAGDTTLDLLRALLLETATSVLERHASTQVVMTVLQNIWSGWLQTAMNMAATSCQCAMPVFGIWSIYDLDGERAESGEQHEGCNYDTFLWWKPLRDIMRSSFTMPMRKEDDASKATALWQRIQQNYYRARRRLKPQLELENLNARYMPAVCNGQLFSTEKCASFTCSMFPFDHSRYSLMQLSTLGDLLMSQAGVDAAALWAARHVYNWTKSPTDPRYETIDDWRKERAVPFPSVLRGADHDTEMYRLRCRDYVLTRLENALGVSRENPMWGPSDDPIASLRVSATWNGIRHPQSSPESIAVVDPLLALPLKTRSRQLSESDWRELQESVEGMILDPHNLSTFRVATDFDSETPHASLATTMRCVLAALIRTATLPPETLCSHLIDIPLISGWDNSAGNIVAQSLAEAAGVCKATQALVTAMDWTHAASDIIDISDALTVVRCIFDADPAFGYPVSPEHVPLLSKRQSMCFEFSAPPGRLLSLLSLHMAKVRSPSSIALVWTLFIQELRERWENKNYVPNMMFVPGLDPVYETLKSKQRFSTLKTPSPAMSAFYAPDPDNSYCLIGQKLQVLNICAAVVHSVCAMSDQVEQIEKRQRLVQDSPSPNSSPLGQVQSTDSDSDEEFYDTIDSEQDNRPFSNGHGSIDASLNEGQHETQTFLSVTHGVAAKRFQKPLHLQRALPLTDDVIAERKLMIAKQSGADSANMLSQKLSLIHRFQRPKLLSDMQAFKAANPITRFEDFVAWYGSPVDPLPEYRDDEPSLEVPRHTLRRRSSRATSMMETTEKLDKAAESIRALTATREFWLKTWESADPVAVAVQEPLFDAAVLAEMSLDYLETLHPANLLCQVMAANLSAAYFALVTSAGDAEQIGFVSRSLQGLRETMEKAIRLLADDALATATASRSRNERHVPASVASIDSIAACERACFVLSESEALVARAVSLLHKLPGQYDLVESLLRCQGGGWITVTQQSARNSVLHAIATQQVQLQPSLRQYIFRGLNPGSPCQLSVSYGLPGECSSVTIALARCSRL